MYIHLMLYTTIFAPAMSEGYKNGFSDKSHRIYTHAINKVANNTNTQYHTATKW